VLAAVFIAGCESAHAPGSSPAVAAPTTVPSASPAAESWPAGGPVPPELSGVWRLGTSAGTMRLSGNTYAFGQSNGNVVVNGNEIAFFNGSGCGMALPGGIGRYSWTLSGKDVHFVSLAPDPCGRADLLADVTWTRP
jgi:hypothetical protein